MEREQIAAFPGAVAALSVIGQVLLQFFLRLLGEQKQICKRAEVVIRRLYARGVRYFGVGGAIGFDTMMAQLLMNLRDKDLPDIKIILVKPFDGFTSKWNDSQKRQYEMLLHQYDKVVCVAERPSRQAYMDRNRHLVDGSAFCVAYCTRNEGGSAYTVTLAKQNGLEVYNVADYCKIV
ncbi:MAG: DUF1273 family protein [Oscillospiraceae bacterium]|nr:DUF1273 family protein [Oscillospiraceae bacterium]